MVSQLGDLRGGEGSAPPTLCQEMSTQLCHDLCVLDSNKNPFHFINNICTDSDVRPFLHPRGFNYGRYLSFVFGFNHNLKNI